MSMLAAADPAYRYLEEDPALTARILTAAHYNIALEDQYREVQDVRKEEAMRLSKHMDYYR